MVRRNPELVPPTSIKMRLNHAYIPKAMHNSTCVSVEDMDSIDCGLKYKSQGYNPVVLNLADDCVPGGCVDIGDGAQEESLFRRTSLFATLDFDLYPIGDEEGIYSPDVHVLKDVDGMLHDNIQRISFMSVPGISCPLCVNRMLCKKDTLRMIYKIRTMLQIAATNGHDCVILGASGCGAWRGPADHIASIFAKTLAEYNGVFKIVAFAILKGPKMNYECFRNTF